MSSTVSTPTLSPESRLHIQHQNNELYTHCLDRWDDLGAELKERWRRRRQQWHAFAEHPECGIPRELDCFELHAEMVELDELIWELEVDGAVDLKGDEREAEDEDEGGVNGVGEVEMGDADEERAVDALLDAVETADGEDNGEKDDEGDKDDDDDPGSGDDGEELRTSSWRKCPVPGCGVERNRLSRINRHLRDDHGVLLETGGGGDMVALRARQDAQFSAWCVSNGLRGDIPREQPIDGEVL